MINKLAAEIHANAKSKGFYDEPKNIGPSQHILGLDDIGENLEEMKKKKYKTKSGLITHCAKCGKPVFTFGLCYDHSAEFEKELQNNVPPTHNDWRLT